jgi:type VII secretion-associated serine protease mycosin
VRHHVFESPQQLQNWLWSVCLLLCGLSLLLTPTFVLAQNPAPNDPRFDEQWSLSLIEAGCAWQFSTGRSEVTVAVIDSGVDLNHPDLVDRLRSDGYDFVADDADPTDENGHGTNVAGVVAATFNNAEGITGLAPNVSILPIRVMNARGKGSDGDIARGVRYAADQGAQVINLSLGATLTIAADTESEVVKSAIRYAQEKGALVVVAAGNDFAQLPNAIVGDLPGVLVVAATDNRDRLAPFSNYGEWIGITAPGVRILSTMPTYEVFLTSDRVPADERFNQNYDYMSGTSQATPLVSALAALLFSARPDWSADQVAQALRETAVNVEERNRSRLRGKLGSGRIDACRALESTGQAAVAPTAAPDAPVNPDASPAPVPTRRPIELPTPALLPGESREPSSGGSLFFVVVGVLGCAAVGVLGLFVLILRSMFRRRPAPSAPRPVYQPPPIPTPAAQPALTPAPATAQPAAGAGAWGSMVVIAGLGEARRYWMTTAETILGRAPECTIAIIHDPTISRRHARVYNIGGQVSLEDLGSSHGTYLNGQRISGRVLANRGDVVQVGQTLLRFE